MHINFWPLHGHRRMCPGLEFVLTKRWRTLMSYSGHISLLGNVFPCSRLDVYFLVLSKHVHQRASGQPPAVSVSCRRRARSFGCSISHLPVSAAGWDPLAMGDWHHWSWSCSSLLWMSQALFHPVPVWVVSFLVTPTSTNHANDPVSWQHLLLLEVGNWCHLLNA